LVPSSKLLGCLSFQPLAFFTYRQECVSLVSEIAGCCVAEGGSAEQVVGQALVTEPVCPRRYAGNASLEIRRKVVSITLLYQRRTVALIDNVGGAELTLGAQVPFATNAKCRVTLVTVSSDTCNVETVFMAGARFANTLTVMAHPTGTL
jgi:hypothetical protein